MASSSLTFIIGDKNESLENAMNIMVYKRKHALRHTGFKLWYKSESIPARER